MSYFDIDAPLSAYQYNQKILQTIKTISLPLLENFGIELVTYRRFFDNGNLLHLSSDSKWLDHCCKCHHWTSHSTLKRVTAVSIDQPIINIWNKQPNSEDNVYGALYEFGFANGATIYERNANSVELWAFSAKNNSQNVDNVYVNYHCHQSILKRFILYFQDRARDILDVSDSSKLIRGTPDLITKIPFNHNEQLDDFNKRTDISKYILRDERHDYVITKREAQCIYYLCQGKTMKEIAYVLNINWRTVETHINNIKLKTHMNSKNGIVDNFYPTIRNWIF